MKYRVEIGKSAEREFRALPLQAKARVTSALLHLADTPRPPGARKLTQGPGWRLRVGDYRILYTIDDGAYTVTVLAVGHRREVYR